MCVSKSSLSHPALKVERFRGKSPKIRKMVQVGGVSPPADFRVLNSSITNLERGVLERVFYAKGRLPPAPAHAQIFTERLRKFKNLLRKRLPPTTPWSAQRFVATYRGRKRTIYEKAALTLEKRAVDERDSRLKVFVKGTEKTDFIAKPDPIPRVISPRSPRYNVALGVFIKAIEHKLYAAIQGVFGSPTVMKGFNAREVAKIIKSKWDKFRRPVGVGLDASRFDQHVSEQALSWEHSVYLDAFRKGSRGILRRLLRWQRRNKCTGYTQDGRLRYKVVGKRCSGDMNTGCGNCLLMCAMVYAYADHLGIKVELINNGDDCVVIMEECDVPRFCQGLDAWFVEMGFTMKVETPVYEMEQIEFCQARPVWLGDEWCMVRNLVGLAKDSICTASIQCPSDFRRWMATVAKGGLSLAGGCPIYQPFYTSLLRASEGAKPFYLGPVFEDEGLYKLGWRMDRVATEILPETRFSFWKAFGVTPDEQIAVESYYNHFTPTMTNINRTTTPKTRHHSVL